MARDDDNWTQEREDMRHEREELRLRLELNEARTKKTEELLAAIATKLGVPRGYASVGEGSENVFHLKRVQEQAVCQVHAHDALVHVDPSHIQSWVVWAQSENCLAKGTALKTNEFVSHKQVTREL
ncbi:hypothetical protein Lal_00022953 [Lupinus albus]|nr:hypothetical protein Lal_00022953 [Lupinus albus]